jgi:TPR repeat protein
VFFSYAEIHALARALCSGGCCQYPFYWRYAAQLPSNKSRD